MFIEVLLIITGFFIIWGLLYYSIIKDYFVGKVFCIIVLFMYVIFAMIYLNRANKVEINVNIDDKLENTCMDIENEYKNYSRKFIRINPNEIMLIHMFKRDVCHQLEDMVLDDNEQYFLDVSNIRKDAAHQLMLQFEGHQCRAFIEALKQECDKWIEEDDKWMVEMDNKLKNKRK